MLGAGREARLRLSFSAQQECPKVNDPRRQCGFPSLLEDSAGSFLLFPLSPTLDSGLHPWVAQQKLQAHVAISCFLSLLLAGTKIEDG